MIVDNCTQCSIQCYAYGCRDQSFNTTACNTSLLPELLHKPVQDTSMQTHTHARTHARPDARTHARTPAHTHARTHCTVLVPLPKRSRGPFRCRRGKGARRVATQTACLDAKPAYASKSLNPRTLAKRVTSTLINSPNYSERPKHTHRNAACTSTPPVVG